MSVGRIREKLPAAHSYEIGRIIAQWARLEWRLKQIAYQLLDLDPKMGRVAIREPRATDYLTMLEDLLHIKKYKLKTDFKDLKNTIDHLATYRDRIAHGIWLRDKSTKIPILQVTKGKWQPDPKKPSIKRLISPEGVPLTAQNLKVLVHLIEYQYYLIDRLHVEVAGAIAKQKLELALQSQPRSRRSVGNQATQKPPPQSSRA